MKTMVLTRGLGPGRGGAARSGMCHEPTAGERVSDAELSSRVGRRLLADPDVNRFAIDVDAGDGRVTLGGTVDSEQLERSAEEIARNTRRRRRGLQRDRSLGLEASAIPSVARVAGCSRFDGLAA